MTEAAKHTRGPWEVRDVDGTLSVMPDPDNRWDDTFLGICTVYRFDVERTEARSLANARLIAAAPEMLSALRMARDTIVSGFGTAGTIMSIDAAIARAVHSEATTN